MEYLSIVTLGPNHPEAISALAELVAKYECSLLRSQVNVFESDLATMSLVCGSWNAIAKLEAAMQNLGEEQDVTILLKRTPVKAQTTSAIPYQAQIIGLDDSNIINDIIAFFIAQQITIENLLLETAVPQSTATTIFNLNIDLNIPTTISIHNLRNDFLSLCEELNVDGILEPAARI